MRLSLDPERQKKAKEYARSRRLAGTVGWLVDAVLLFLIIFGGISSKIRNAISLPTIPAAIVLFLVLVLAYSVISFPFQYYQGFVLPHHYGLSTQNLRSWIGDGLKGLMLNLVLGSGFIALLYWFLYDFPEIWWLLSWGVMLVFSLLLANLAPVAIIPLFLKMRPLGDSELKSKLEELARRAGIKVRGIFIIEFSRKSTTANAAVMGLGNTRRIVLSDTLLEQYPPAEIEVIMAHEFGHQANGDTYRLFTIQSAVMLLILFFGNLLFKYVVASLNFSALSDIAALPWLALIFAALSFIIAPLINAYSRHIETAADDYALSLTDDPDAFANAMTRLTEQNLSVADPGRWIELLTYSHPSYYRRLRHADEYAASKGK